MITPSPLGRLLARLRPLAPTRGPTPRGPDKVCPPMRPADWRDAVDLLGHTTEFPCHFRPGGATWTCMRDTITNSEGRPRRVEEHDPSASSEVACVGEATIWDSITRGGDVVVCAAHDRWLRQHRWIDGMSSRMNAKRMDGVWVSTRHASAS